MKNNYKFLVFKPSLFYFLLMLAFTGYGQTNINWVDENVDHPVDKDLNFGYSTSVTTHNGDIYYTYVGSDQKIYVGKKRNGQDNVNAVMTSLQSDDYHTKPSIAVDKNGYIHLTGDSHNQDWKYYISNEPGNIYSWTRRYPPGQRVTYMEFYKDRNDELYILFRMKLGNASEDHVGTMMRYNAGNSTFDLKGSTNYNPDGPVVKAMVYGLDGGGFGCAYQQPRPRIFFDSNNRMHLTASVIDVCYTSGNSGYDRQTHVIYAYSDDGGNTFKKANGASISLPLTTANASVVVNRSSQQDILPESHVGAFDTNTPIVSYRTQNGTAYAKKWTGSSWTELSLPDRSSSLFMTNTNGVAAWYHKYETGNARFNFTSDGNTWTSVNAPGNGTSNRYVEAIDQQHFEDSGDFRIHFAYFTSNGQSSEVHTFDTSGAVGNVAPPSGGNNDISSIDGPNSVSPNKSYAVSVAYSSSSAKDLVVELQRNSSPWTVYGSTRTNVTSGSRTVNVTVPVNGSIPIADNNYKWIAYLTTPGGGWNQRSADLQENNIDAVPDGNGSSGNVKVRARITNGNSDQLQLRINNTTVKTWTINGSGFTNYSHTLSTGGNVKLYFPDNGTDMEIDWLEIDGIRYQAEAQVTNTSVYENGSCGGDFSQLMHCEGHIDFGTINGNSSGGGSTLQIRARGQCGSETMILEVGGQNVKTFNNVSTSTANYSYDGYSSGTVKVKFTNDANNGCDRNLFVDYVKVGNTTYQTENKATRSGCGNDQWLWCNGNFNFGNLGSTSLKASLADVSTDGESKLSVYPNPLQDAQLHIDINGEAGSESEIIIVDVAGRIIYKTSVPSDEQLQLDASIFDKSELYFVSIKTNETTTTKKLLVNLR